MSFADPNLEAAVRAALGKPTGELSSTDLLALEDLGAPNQGITSLAGLEGATNLRYLNLENNAISDATPLAKLTALQHLYLDSNRLTSAAALAGLPQLEELLLDYNSINDVSWLARLPQLRSVSLMFNPLASAAGLTGLTNLTELHINGTGISDVSWLRAMHNLTILGLGDNGIRDASPLAGLTKLQFLGYGGNQLGNCSILAGLTDLRTLYLFGDSISNLTGLASLKNLTWLRLADNQVSDASPLAGLNQLQYLDLSWNPLGSCAALAGLTALTEMDLAGTSLTNVGCLSGLRNLRVLRISHNFFSDASPLANLTSLQNLNLSNNLVANLDFVAALPRLTNLDASGNRLTDIKGLLSAVSLSSADLHGNLLLLATGSSAYNVIQTLRSRGVTVDDSFQSLPYVATNGTYYGLFCGDSAVTHSNSGCITLTTTVTRKYTGKLRIGGIAYALQGSFNPDGSASKTVLSGKRPPLFVSLVMEGADYLTGTVGVSGQTSPADILGYRAVFDGKARRSPQAGRYTLVLAGSNSPALPAGNSYGTLTVSPAGKLSLAGALADGTKFSQSGWVSSDGMWPLYAPLYAGRGSVLSWLTFTNNQALGGDLLWIKPSGTTKSYPAGFAWLTQAIGARYTPPGKGTNAFATTGCNLTLTLTGGDLKRDLVSQLVLDAKGKVKVLSSASKVNLSFTPSTGRFNGRTTDPDTRKGVVFSGVILQNQTNGCGFFSGGSTSGQVLLCE